MGKTQKLKLLYNATQSLDVKYTFSGSEFEGTSVVVPAVDTHARLRMGYRDLLTVRGTLTYGTGRQIYTRPLTGVNFATAAVTFLYTDTTPEEGYLGEDVEQSTFHLSINGQQNRILSTTDLFNISTQYRHGGATRDTQFNRFLSERVGTFSEFFAHYDMVKDLKRVAFNKAELQTQIAGSQFHHRFHHSEQVPMHYLSSPTGIKDLTRRARVDAKATYLYGIVLDIYTYLMLCGNCNVSLLGMQNSQGTGFLRDFSDALVKKGIQPRNGHDLMLNVRVSTSKAGPGQTLEDLKLADDRGTTHTYNSDGLPEVFQARNRSLRTLAVINQRDYSITDYHGAFFTSKMLNSQRLERAIGIPGPANA